VSRGTRTPTIDDSEPCTRKTGRAGINVVTLDGDQLHPHPKPSSAFASPMAFKLHGISTFSCTRRVALIAKERNVPYKLVTVNLEQAEHKTPAYLAHQPFGQLPYIAVRPVTLPPRPLLHHRSGVFSDNILSSKTTASSCTNRAPSAATSRRSGLGPS